MTYILGIYAYYHDSAAALIKDGEILSAVEEERFTRKKHDGGFPHKAVNFCLKEEGIHLHDVSYIVFYDKPLIKFERILETFISYAPKGVRMFLNAMPVWLKEKIHLKKTLQGELIKSCDCPIESIPPILYTEHHQSHAASAFFPSPFDEAAVLCIDGVGEWSTTSLWFGKENTLTPKWELRFPHSLGLLYSAFTYYTGFKVNSGEYKLMGLAPYGEPKYTKVILENLIDLKLDGTFRLNMEYFSYPYGFTMTNHKFHKLFGGNPRLPDEPLTQREMDIARSIQVVTEETILRLARTAHKELGTKNLCLAGGVALNCVANGLLLKEGPFKNIWVQPAASDAGSAIGAALCGWHEYLGKQRQPTQQDSMKGGYLGPKFTKEEIINYLHPYKAHFQELKDSILFPKVAELLSAGKVIGWFQGRMEFGPRALGNRSILGDPRNEDMQKTMNLKIKFRESFRPFAPSIHAESAKEFFDRDHPSPYMQFVAPLNEKYRIPLEANPAQENHSGLDLLKLRRSKVPAITHVDYSARIQTVQKNTNPRFHALIKEFAELTQYPLLINTSFNVRGEPIVCTPEDAYRCFMRTNIDYLIIENFLFAKEDQPTVREPHDTFELD
jgi:carbamoyltransferase